MKKHTLLLLSVLLFLFPEIQAQDTINLLNGKQILTSKIYEDTSRSVLKYDITFHNKVKQRELDLLNIYSISYTAKTEKIIYKQDSALGFELSENDMSYLIMGERDALKNHKTPWVTISSFVAGAAAAHYLQFWGLLSPVACATAFGVFTPKIHASPGRSIATKDNYNYREGYKYTSTRKKVKNALFGSFVGFAACALFEYSLYLANKE